MNIGENIQEFRRKNNLTQEELANKMNVSYKTISSWENNRNIPSIDMVLELSKVLGVSLDEIIGTDTDAKVKYVKESKKKDIYKILYLSFMVLIPLIYLFVSFYNILIVEEFVYNSTNDVFRIFSDSKLFLLELIYPIGYYAVIQICNYIFYTLKMKKIMFVFVILEFIMAIIGVISFIQALFDFEFAINGLSVHKLLEIILVAIIPFVFATIFYFLNKKNS